MKRLTKLCLFFFACLLAGSILLDLSIHWTGASLLILGIVGLILAPFIADAIAVV